MKVAVRSVTLWSWATCQMLVNAVYQHDHFAIQGVVLIVAVGFVLINLAVDTAYALLDPRVRHGVDS